MSRIAPIVGGVDGAVPWQDIITVEPGKAAQLIENRHARPVDPPADAAPWFGDAPPGRMRLIRKQAYRAILSWGINGNYAGGLARLWHSLNVHAPDIDRLMWRNRFPATMPQKHHETLPRVAKFYALHEAIILGYTTILWADATVWLVRPIHELIDRIETDGYYFTGWQNVLAEMVDPGCHGLKVMNATKEEIYNKDLILGGLWGIDFTKPIGKELAQAFLDSTKNGSFEGFKGGCDEIPITLLVHRLGLKYDDWDKSFFRLWSDRDVPHTMAKFRGV